MHPMNGSYRKLCEILGEVADLRVASAVLEWDQQTYMPPGGAGGRALALGTLGTLAHARFVSDEVGALLEAAQAEFKRADPDSDEARLLKVTRRLYDKERKVSGEWVGEFTRETSLAQQAWQQARAASDFARFQPHLERVMALRRAYADFFAPYDSVYDPLLDDFEPGMKTAEVRAIFEALRPQQVALIQAIVDKGPVVDDRLLYQAYDEQAQWDFGLEVARTFGYDLARGRQDRSAHPFTTDFGHGDVRITTRLDPNFLPKGMFGTFHETGHALYGQGVPERYYRTPLATALSLAVHESQSRTWENLVGRSRPFWAHFYPRLQKAFPGPLGGVDLETFYRAVNKVEPSLIRVEADEATYNLHIMLRFELELALMEGRLAVADLPAAWNERVQEFLGLTPPDDAHGVLQDIHWSGGGVGYFPTYALGNLVAAQLWEAVLAAVPDLEAQIARGEFAALLDWQRRNLHQFGGKFEPMELIARATGAPLSPEPYLRYLRGKFGAIYGL
jgi:carboxypeptidase Taq